MTNITLSGVGKTYGSGVDVLADINLEIQSGELLVFVGPSGCGKSTLLRMIAGLETITSGELTIDGQRMNEMPSARRGIAMVFQSYALYPHMSVRDNMAFALKIAGRSKAQIEEAIMRVAASLKITELLDRLPKELSGGQRQRVAIGRSIVRDPKVYLFDEPLSNLDAALRVATRIEIAELKESMPDSTTMTLASRIVVLAGGGISQVGTPLELYEKPQNEFVAGFIGSPAMNFMPATIVQTGEVTTVKMLAGHGTVSAAIPTTDELMGAEVNIGIRPEDLTITDSATFAFDAEVKIAEELGEVTQLYFDINSSHVQEGAGLPVAGVQRERKLVIAKMPGIHRNIRGRQLRMAVDPAKVHLFLNGESLLYCQGTI